MSHKLLQNMRSERGFSLLELLLVVGVGALLLLAGIGTYRLVTEGNNINNATQLLATLKQQTQRAFRGQATYGNAGDDLVPILVDLRAVPADVVTGPDGSEELVHPFGGSITITVGSSAGAGQSFVVTFEDVNQATCIQMGALYSQDNDSDFIEFTAGGSAVTDTDLVTLQAACTDDADISWEFY